MLTESLDDPTKLRRLNLINFGGCSLANSEGICIDIEWRADNELIQRINKAFKHLAYLANEERKKSKF